MTSHPAYLQSQQCPSCRRVTRPGLSPADPVLCSPACAESERRRLGLPPHGPFAVIETVSTFRRYDVPADTGEAEDCEECGSLVPFPGECGCREDWLSGGAQEREAVAAQAERPGWLAWLRRLFR